jgi:hypothetical protein
LQLKSSPAARILHVFERACNLINDEGEIMALVAAGIGPGPFAIVVPLPAGRAFGQLITANTPVMVTGEGLRLGSLTVQTARASLWPPRPAWERLQKQPANLPAYLPAIRARLTAHTPAVTTLGPYGRRRWTEATALLLQGLALCDPAICRQAARALAGFGHGLTPAGDDFLLGAIYALWATRPVEEAQRLVEVVVEAAIPRTTSLSAAWLKAAARGEAGAPWHDLVQAVSGQWAVGSEQWTVMAAVERILATGHTSGADALAGFTAVLARGW